jgi:hypothetical protein
MEVQVGIQVAATSHRNSHRACHGCSETIPQTLIEISSLRLVTGDVGRMMVSSAGAARHGRPFLSGDVSADLLKRKAKAAT